MQTKCKVNHCNGETGICHIHINAAPSSLCKFWANWFVVITQKRGNRRAELAVVLARSLAGGRRSLGPIQVPGDSRESRRRTSCACTFLMHLPAQLAQFSVPCQDNSQLGQLSGTFPPPGHLLSEGPPVTLCAWFLVLVFPSCVPNSIVWRHGVSGPPIHPARSHSYAKTIQNFSCEWALKSQSTSTELPLFPISSYISGSRLAELFIMHFEAIAIMCRNCFPLDSPVTDLWRRLWSHVFRYWYQREEKGFPFSEKSSLFSC